MKILFPSFALPALFILAACASKPHSPTSTAIPAPQPEPSAEQVQKGEALRAEGLELLFSKDPSVKNPQKAFQKFQEAAALGDPVSMDQLGGFYVAGTGGVEKNCAKAMEWFEKSTQGGYPVAVNNLAYMLVTCEDKKLRNPERAEEMVRFLLESNPVFLALLDTYATVLAEQGNFKKAAETMQTVVELGDLMAVNPERLDEMKETLRRFRQGKSIPAGKKSVL